MRRRRRSCIPRSIIRDACDVSLLASAGQTWTKEAQMLLFGKDPEEMLDEKKKPATIHQLEFPFMKERP